MVKDVTREEAGLAVHTEKGSLSAGAVIAGIGISVNDSLAKEAGLMVENGIRVNASLQTSDPDIYAAGDAASFYSSRLGEYVRFEHEINARSMGKSAGANMAGSPVTYEELPVYYSDMFDLGYEAVGRMNNRMDVVADWREPFRKGVLYYTQEGIIRGVMLWNVWDRTAEALPLISRSIEDKGARVTF